MKRLLPVVMCMVVPLAFWGCAQPREQAEPVTSEAYEKALAMLQEQAHASDPSARAQCMESLQVLHDTRALDVIEQGLHDPEPVVRFAAAMASGQQKADRMRPVLNTMVTHDADMSVRAGCIFALRRMGDVSHMNELAVMLQSKDWEVRANAALVLGKLGERSAVSLLNDFGNDPDIRVRFEITAALARLGDEAAQRLVASQTVELYAEDQFHAMAVCADLPERVGTAPLLLGLRDAPKDLPPTVDPAQVKFLTTQRQLVAARSLAKLKYNNERAAELAIDNRDNSDPKLRALAYLALGDMLSSRQTEAMELMLADSDKDVQRAAAAAVVNIYARAAMKNAGG